MIISRAAEYGLISVGYIALHQKESKITAKVISDKFNIPLQFLFRILNGLNKAGILLSKRGLNGGYVLARKPGKLSLLDIIKTIEGSNFDPLSVIEHNSNQQFIVRMKKVCKKATAEKNKILSKATLAEMISGLKDR